MTIGFEFCVFVAGWRHALRSEWPFIIIIIKFSVYHNKCASLGFRICQILSSLVED